MTKKTQSIEGVAASLGLEAVDTGDAIREVYFSILRSTYRYFNEDELQTIKELQAKKAEELTEADKEKLNEHNARVGINKKIEAAFKNATGGQDWIEDRAKILSTMLVGPPGHGKTTVFKVAAKKAAEDLGMRFLINPTEDINIGLNDFVFTSLEFSGENSKMELSGLPMKGNVQGHEAMTHLNNWRLGCLPMAGAGLLLLDDFTNATSNIQNIGLSITDEKRYQGLNLKNVTVGLTGNLGAALDGTNTSNASTALGSRVKTSFIRDNLKDFTIRTQNQYQDELGDLGLLGFLNNNEQLFAQLPDARTKGGFPCPRAWDNFILDVRRLVQEVGGREHAMNALTRIATSAGQLLGQEVKQGVRTYIHAMLTSADPLARKVIFEGDVDIKELEKRYNTGFSAEEQHFAFQYTQSMAQYAVTRIVNEKGDMTKAVTNFVEGISIIDSTSLAAAIDTFANNLAMRVPQYSTANTNGTRSLTLEAKKEIAGIMSKTKKIDAERAEVITQALSNADKYEATHSRNRTRRS